MHELHHRDVGRAAAHVVDRDGRMRRQAEPVSGERMVGDSLRLGEQTRLPDAQLVGRAAQDLERIGVRRPRRRVRDREGARPVLQGLLGEREAVAEHPLDDDADVLRPRVAREVEAAGAAIAHGVLRAAQHRVGVGTVAEERFGFGAHVLVSGAIACDRRREVPVGAARDQRRVPVAGGHRHR